MWAEALQLANTKAGGEIGRGVGNALTTAAQGIFGDEPAPPVISGGGAIDSRGFLDGSQWTVSTGGGSATGGARTSGEAFPAANYMTGTPAAPMVAGLNGPLGLVLALLLVGAVLRKKG